MHIDVMVGATTWAEAAQTACDVEAAGFSGMVFTETSQTPWIVDRRRVTPRHSTRPARA